MPVSHGTMWDEIDEISERLDLSEWEMSFLEDIKTRAHDGTLSEKQAAVLEKIYRRACESPY